MKLFNTIAIEITAACNRRCKFCPVSVYQRPDETMPEQVFQAILGELNHINYAGRIEFYIYNEPLKNKDHLAYCAKQTSAAVPRATLMISTNGDYLKGPEDIEWIFSIGVNQIVLNAYSPQQYPKFMEWKRTLEDTHGPLSETVYSKIPRNAKALKVYDKSDSSSFGDGVFAITNRAGNIPEFLSATCEPVSRMCVKPFRLLNINWRGEAIICCNDYYADVPCGTVPEQSLIEIWEGPIFAAYRKKLLNKERTLPMCRSCDCHSGAYPGNEDKSESEAVATEDEIEAIYASRVGARSGS